MLVFLLLEMVRLVQLSFLMIDKCFHSRQEVFVLKILPHLSEFELSVFLKSFEPVIISCFQFFLYYSFYSSII